MSRSTVHRAIAGFNCSSPHLACGRPAGTVLVVGRRGDLAARHGELLADRLDTPSQTLPVAILATVTDVFVDEHDDQCCGRSSSAAKKAEAESISRWHA